MVNQRRLPFVERRRLKGGELRFRASVWIAGQRVVSPWVETEEAAYEAAVAARNVGAAAGLTLEAGTAMLLDELRAKRTAGSVRWYAGHLAAVAAKIPKETPLHRITPEMLEQFVRDRLAEPVRKSESRKVQPSTVNADLRALHRLFAVALRRGYVSSNPVRMVDRPRADVPAMDWFTADELQQLLARVTDEGARDLFAFLAMTGLRRSELARLQPSHVRVRPQHVVVPGKTGTRVVPLSRDLIPTICRMMVLAAPERLVPGGLPAIDRAFRVWSKALQEPRLHCHALRHTFGTMLIRQGERPDVVMRLMGHRSLSVTLRYLHECGEESAAAIDRLRLLPREPDRQEG